MLRHGLGRAVRGGGSGRKGRGIPPPPPTDHLPLVVIVRASTTCSRKKGLSTNRSKTRQRNDPSRRKRLDARPPPHTFDVFPLPFKILLREIVSRQFFRNKKLKSHKWQRKKEETIGRYKGENGVRRKSGGWEGEKCFNAITGTRVVTHSQSAFFYPRLFPSLSPLSISIASPASLSSSSSLCLSLSLSLCSARKENESVRSRCTVQ